MPRANSGNVRDLHKPAAASGTSSTTAAAEAGVRTLKTGADTAGPRRDTATRGMLSAHLWMLADQERPDIRSDADRLARLTERLGDVASAYLHGHRDIDGEVMLLAATALSWLEAHVTDGAA